MSNGTRITVQVTPSFAEAFINALSDTVDRQQKEISKLRSMVATQGLTKYEPTTKTHKPNGAKTFDGRATRYLPEHIRKNAEKINSQQGPKAALNYVHEWKAKNKVGRFGK